MANIKEIARVAGVSVGTVSHVLNGSANVREPLRKRVLETIASLQYQPSELARGLRRVSSSILGMIIPDITNPFFPMVVRGAEDVAFAEGYRLVLCNTDNDSEKEVAHLNQLRSFQPAGLIVIPSHFSNLARYAKDYEEAGASVVCVDRVPAEWVGDTVTVDNEAGAYSAVQYLIQLGHRHIGILSGPSHLTNARDRASGYRRAMREAGLRVSREYEQECSFDKGGGYAKTQVLLRLLPRPTAIFGCNDMLAIGAMAAVRSAGLRCPEDVSLMGFDDLEIADQTYPPLSTVTQPGYQLGSIAAEMLVERIRKARTRAKHRVLETRLQIRETTAPAPSSVLPRKRRAADVKK